MTVLEVFLFFDYRKNRAYSLETAHVGWWWVLDVKRTMREQESNYAWNDQGHEAQL